MITFDEVDIYLLNKWHDISKLQNAINSLNNKMKGFIEEIVSGLKDREWWDKRQFGEPYVTRKMQIGIGKKSWIIGPDQKWDHVSIWIEPFDLDNLLGISDRPIAGIWTSRLGVQQTDFNKVFNQETKEIREKMKATMDFKDLDDEEYSFGYYLPQTPSQWIEILEVGKFVETILQNFDNLAKFIDPVSRALSAVGKIKK